MYEWSNITEQTAHIKVGYVGQHLASVLLNTIGCQTAGRGDDCKINLRLNHVHV